MQTFDQYHDAYIHPLWLGIIMLFTVIIVMSIACLIRIKYGSQILHLFNRLCFRKKLNHEKSIKHLSISNPYHRPPVYIPAPSLSSKLYTLVRNNDKDSALERIDSNDDIFSIAEEPNQELNNNRDCETARKFYASMRHTTQSEKSSSIDSHSELSILPINRNGKLKTFPTKRFFQSITN